MTHIPAWIYVMADQSGNLKVGWSTNLRRRQKENAKTRTEIILVFAADVAPLCAAFIETYIHRQLRIKYRYAGEWYSAPRDDLLAMVRASIEQYYASHMPSLRPTIVTGAA